MVQSPFGAHILFKLFKKIIIIYFNLFSLTIILQDSVLAKEIEGLEKLNRELFLDYHELLQEQVKYYFFY